MIQILTIKIKIPRLSVPNILFSITQPDRIWCTLVTQLMWVSKVSQPSKPIWKNVGRWKIDCKELDGTQWQCGCVHQALQTARGEISM